MKTRPELAEEYDGPEPCHCPERDPISGYYYLCEACERWLENQPHVVMARYDGVWREQPCL